MNWTTSRWHAALTGFPIVKGLFGNPVLASDAGHLSASLLQDRNNLLAPRYHPIGLCDKSMIICYL